MRGRLLAHGREQLALHRAQDEGTSRMDPSQLPDPFAVHASVSTREITTARPGRMLLIAGALLLAVGLSAFLVLGAQVMTRVGQPAAQAMNAPVLTTPLQRAMPFAPGDYVIFERVGHRAQAGGITVTNTGAVTLHPAQVRLAGPDGGVVPTSDSFSGGVQNLTRGSDIYTQALVFHVATAGTYQVGIATDSPLSIVIAPSLTPDLSGLHGMSTTTGAALAVVIGLVTVGTGWARRRAASARAAAAASAPNAGWYPDPYQEAPQRYWDGRRWTGRLSR
ncbi:MAG: DUF2510 domain-containing protein [Kineosporiaceae bacterium]